MAAGHIWKTKMRWTAGGFISLFSSNFGDAKVPLLKIPPGVCTPGRSLVSKKNLHHKLLDNKERVSLQLIVQILHCFLHWNGVNREHVIKTGKLTSSRSLMDRALHTFVLMPAFF